MSHDRCKVLCIGAGNLTKGLLYPLFKGAGHDVTVVCMTDKSVDTLRGGYVFHEARGEAIAVHKYTNISAYHISKLPQNIFNDVKLITTAVGRSHLSQVADVLRNHTLPSELRLILCENDINCFRDMRGVVAHVYPSVVDRIVYTDDEQHTVGEYYYSFEIFNKKRVELPTEIVQKIGFKVAYTIKLYLVNTLHSLIAWHGHILGKRYINEAIAEECISQLVKSATIELMTILMHKFPHLKQHELLSFANKNIERFSNKNLLDPIPRVGRNTMQKLGRLERFFEPICYARQYGLPYLSLLQGASFGLLFHADVETIQHPMELEEIFSYVENF